MGIHCFLSKIRIPNEFKNDSMYNVSLYQKNLEKKRKSKIFALRWCSLELKIFSPSLWLLHFHNIFIIKFNILNIEKIIISGKYGEEVEYSLNSWENENYTRFINFLSTWRFDVHSKFHLTVFLEVSYL